MVGVDGSEPAQRALAYALDEGRLRDWDVEVVHAWTFPAMGLSPSDPTPGEDILDRALAAADVSGVRVTRRMVLEDSAPALLDSAESADLLVLGTRGRGGFAGLLMGSTSQHCTHHPPCPIAIVP